MCSFVVCTPICDTASFILLLPTIAHTLSTLQHLAVRIPHMHNRIHTIRHYLLQHISS